jgi:protein arginine kinase activator
MKCEAPGCNNPATVHLTQLQEGGKKKSEKHLCEQCAETEGITTPMQHLTLEQILSTMSVKSDESGEGQTSCPDCGMNFDVFRTSGRLGCAKDYDVFREELIPLIERMHDATEHHGKIPSRAEELQSRRMQAMQLSESLRDAVDREDYEKAAELRDRIKQIEESGHASC